LHAILTKFGDTESERFLYLSRLCSFSDRHELDRPAADFLCDAG
jgi:hypothetical protein